MGETNENTINRTRVSDIFPVRAYVCVCRINNDKLNMSAIRDTIVLWRYERLDLFN